jgi:hypothetical protein
MPSTETKVIVYARDTHGREVFIHGANADSPTYGQIEVVRVTKFRRVADGNVRRVLDETENVEVLATLTADEAEHLLRTLATALVTSLKVRSGIA